jgi:hypothetical protein
MRVNITFHFGLFAWVSRRRREHFRAPVGAFDSIGRSSNLHVAGFAGESLWPMQTA